MKNQWEYRDDHVVIFIKKRDGILLECHIDYSDLPSLISHGKSWCAFWSDTAKTWYVYCKKRRPERGQLLLHRFLLGTPDNLHVDHWDHDGLNNRRANIRSVTRSVNQLNHRMQTNNTSGFRGVIWDKDRDLWQARVKVKGKTVLVGRFIDPSRANEAIKKYRIEVLGCAE